MEQVQAKHARRGGGCETKSESWFTFLAWGEKKLEASNAGRKRLTYSCVSTAGASKFAQVKKVKPKKKHTPSVAHAAEPLPTAVWAVRAKELTE